MGYIYILTSPSGKSYIGQTIRPIEKRFKAHQKESNNCVALYNAIKYHGWNNFEKDWYECPDEDLNFDEELLVREMGTLSPGGYNLKEGGGANGKMSDETKQKISYSTSGEKNPMYGKTHTEETKQNIREARVGKSLSNETKQKISDSTSGEKNHNYGKNMSEETKQKLSVAHCGKILSEETKQKLSKSRVGKTLSNETKQKISDSTSGEKNHMFGKIHTEETKQKMSDSHIGEKNHKSKKVYQYDLVGTLIGSFGSAEEAGRHLKKEGSSIRMCARRKQKTAYGFKWSYTKF